MIATLQGFILLALSLVVFVTCVFALVDAVRRPAKAFVDGGKLTRTLWLCLLVGATAVAFVTLPWPLGWGGPSMLAFVLLCAVVSGVYLADVKPAVARYSGGGRGGRGGRGPQGPQGPRGGW